MRALPDVLVLPGRTLTGPGKAARLLPECAAWGRRGLVVHSGAVERGGLIAEIRKAEPRSLDVTWHCHAGGEPTLGQLDSLLDTARRASVDWVAAVGGGSVIDVAKACAGLLRAPAAPVAYHDGAEVPSSDVPFAAVPTTAGTGSEATFVSVFTNEKTGVKKSFRHASFMARLVLLDPGVLAGCPPAVVAGSGMDALTQGLESFVSKGVSWVSDMYALESVRLTAASLEPVYRGEREAPTLDLLLGSYFAGIALCNARLGLVHGLAHPLGARYKQPHGRVCAVCLPHVLAFNRPAIEDKYRAVSEAVGGDLAGRVDELLRALEIRSPFPGQPIQDRAGIIEETLASGSTTANPRRVAAEDVEVLLDRIFQTG